MSINEAEQDYVSKADKSYIKRYTRFVASPTGKKRLKGESWECYEEWLDEKKPSTRATYIMLLLAFLEWLDWDSEQLFEYYNILCSERDPRKKKAMRRKLSTFQDHYAQSRGITDSQASNIFSAIAGFFKANSMTLIYYSRKKHTPKEMTNISKNQLRKVLDQTTSLKFKCAIYLAKDSGMRISDIVALKVRKIQKVLDDPKIRFHAFEIMPEKNKEKSKVKANPVIGPESIKYIRLWYDYCINVLGIAMDEDSHLLCIEKNAKSFTNKNGVTVQKITKGEVMDATGLSTTFRSLRKKARLKPFPGEKKLPSIHSCRKFHQTALESVKVPENWINKFTGRKGKGTSGTYSKPHPDELIAVYKSAYRALNLTETVEVDENKRLKAELAEKDRQLAEYREQVAKIDKQGDAYQSLMEDVKALKKAQGLE